MTREGESRLLLALGLVAAAGVYSFSRVFTGRAWLIPLLAAAWGGIAVARACAHLRFPKVIAAVLLGVVGALVVLVVVFPQTMRLGLPVPSTIRQAWHTVRMAQGTIAQVTAPVSPDPGYLALAMAATWVAGALSGMLLGSPHAIGRKEEGGLSALSASLLSPLPWIVLFTVAAGVGQGRGRLFDASLFYAATLVYLLAEGWSALGKLPRLDGALRLGVLAMAGAILLPNLVPGYRAGPVFPWARIGPTTETTVSPLVQIKPFLLQQSNVDLFKVDADQEAYWRLTALDRFDGTTWSSQGTYNPASGSLSAPPPGTAPDIIQQRYSIANLGGIWVPAAYEASRVSGLKSSFDPSSQTLIVTALHPGQSYGVVSTAPNPTGPQLSDAGAGNAPSAEDVRLPPATLTKIRPLTLPVVGTDTNAYDQAVDIQKYLRTFTYDEHVAADSSTDYLVAFLTKTKAGFCQQFAGAMAVMLRALGIPARVAVGFLPGQQSLSAGGVSFDVTGRDAHAWPEAYFAGIGWVAFEPTPRADAPPPPYTVAPAVAPTPLPTEGPSSQQSQSPGASASAPSPTPTHSAAPHKSHPAISVARRASDDLLLALALFLALLFVAREVRLRLGEWTARSPRQKVLAAYEEFVLRAADARGQVRRPGETEAEHARSVTAGLSLPKDGAAQVAILTQAYQRAAYAPQPPGPEELEAALHANRVLRRLIRKGADWRGKVRLAFSPRPLFGRSGGSPRSLGGPPRYARPLSSSAPSAARKA